MGDPLAQALALLRSHADVCSRYGCSDQLRAEADRIESLAGVAAGPQTTPRVLWEGETQDSDERWYAREGRSYLLPGEIHAPPGTRVRVVAAPTSQQDHDG